MTKKLDQYTAPRVPGLASDFVTSLADLLFFHVAIDGSLSQCNQAFL